MLRAPVRPPGPVLVGGSARARREHARRRARWAGRTTRGALARQSRIFVEKGRVPVACVARHKAMPLRLDAPCGSQGNAPPHGQNETAQRRARSSPIARRELAMGGGPENSNGVVRGKPFMDPPQGNERFEVRVTFACRIHPVPNGRACIAGHALAFVQSADARAPPTVRHRCAPKGPRERGVSDHPAELVGFAGRREAPGESRRGTSPLRALRTGLEPLDSSGSHQSAVGRIPSFQ
jgi:hypothetical protein